MNWVDQIMKMAGATGRVAFTIFLACTIVVTAEHYAPEHFAGLPEFVLPALKVLAIFTGVASLVSGSIAVVRLLKRAWPFVAGPFRIAKIRKELRTLPEEEMKILRAVQSTNDRHFRLQEDRKEIISLREKGLIKTRLAFRMDGGYRRFEIPLDVWRILQETE
ncbi:hypothetical protein [Roseovarius sp. THAF9]|uniref:hypothetical protein n=1 Tax=Roseovarius sp. THAF9 TaxID=2587847 RepID=UPI0012697F20|nr:hypothetical protein [Roseovarius sp. THAF9]